jgi:hypothetical protein
MANSGVQALNMLRDKPSSADTRTTRWGDVEVKVEEGFRVVGGEDEVEASRKTSQVGSIRY